jgi:hypothetical protein
MSAQLKTERDGADFAFRSSNISKDGILSRPEFSSALRMVIQAVPEAQAVYSQLGIDEIDEIFKEASDGADGITPTQFDLWKLRFKDGFLAERTLLRELPLEPPGEAAAWVQRAALPERYKSPLPAIHALSLHCPALLSLAVRTDACDVAAIVNGLLEPTPHGPLAQRLKRLDLSGLAVCDDDVCALAPACSSLVVLRLAGCDQVGEGGVSAISQHCAGTLRRLVLSPETSDVTLGASGPAALRSAGCEVLSRVFAGDAVAHPRTEDVDLLMDKPEVVQPISHSTIDVEVRGAAGPADENGQKPRGGGCCIIA